MHYTCVLLKRNTKLQHTILNVFKCVHVHYIFIRVYGSFLPSQLALSFKLSYRPMKRRNDNFHFFVIVICSESSYHFLFLDSYVAQNSRDIWYFQMQPFHTINTFALYSFFWSAPCTISRMTFFVRNSIFIHHLHRCISQFTWVMLDCKIRSATLKCLHILCMI